MGIADQYKGELITGLISFAGGVAASTLTGGLARFWVWRDSRALLKRDLARYRHLIDLESSEVRACKLLVELRDWMRANHQVLNCGRVFDFYRTWLEDDGLIEHGRHSSLSVGPRIYTIGGDAATEIDAHYAAEDKAIAQALNQLKVDSKRLLYL